MYGVSESVPMDNDPLYISNDWSKFSKSQGIQHRPKTPMHPEGNSLAQNSFVKTFLTQVDRTYLK